MEARDTSYPKDQTERRVSSWTVSEHQRNWPAQTGRWMKTMKHNRRNRHRRWLEENSPRQEPPRELRRRAETGGGQESSTTNKARAQAIDDLSPETKTQKHTPNRETARDDTRRNQPVLQTRQCGYTTPHLLSIGHRELPTTRRQAQGETTRRRTTPSGQRKTEKRIDEQILSRGASCPIHAPRNAGIRRGSKRWKTTPSESRPKKPTQTSYLRCTYLAVSPEVQTSHRFQPRNLRWRSSNLQGHLHIGGRRKRREGAKKKRG